MHDKLGRVPDISELRAHEEEQQTKKWQTFLIRQRDQQKAFKKF